MSSEFWRRKYDPRMNMERIDISNEVFDEISLYHFGTMLGVNFDEMSDDDYETVLEHFGVKGMRWGVRRYQNEDGSLTSAGKKRYNNGLNDVGSNMKKELTSRTANTAGKAAALTVGASIGGAAGISAAIGGSAGLAAGPVGAVLGAALGGAIGTGMTIRRYIKEKRQLKEYSNDPDAVANMTPGSNRRKLAESGTLAKAADDHLGFGEKMRSFINKKLTAETKKNMKALDNKWKEYENRYNSTDSKQERKAISASVNKEMNLMASNILQDMGWGMTKRNVYYLSQVIWLDANKQNNR